MTATFKQAAFADLITATSRNDGSLPRCEDLTQNPSSPFSNGAFLTSRTTQVVWKVRNDGSRELTLPHTCQLKRYTAQEAGKCLRNKHLLFIGDSLTRYQFLSLAYFLERKRWPPRYQTSGYTPCTQFDEGGQEACSKIDEPNVCCETDWELNGNGGWPAFMQALGGGVDGSLFHGRMEAQSIRVPISIERYEYISSEEDGRTKLSSLSEFFWPKYRPYHGWNLTGCAKTGSCRYSPESYIKNIERDHNSDWDWDYPNIAEAFTTGSQLHTELQDTNYAFYNRGLWGALQIDKAQIMMDALRNMTGGRSEANNRCFFRSTTGCQRTREWALTSMEYNDVRKTSYESGCEYFDIGHVTEEFGGLYGVDSEFKHVFWNDKHYVSLSVV